MLDIVSLVLAATMLLFCVALILIGVIGGRGVYTDWIEQLDEKEFKTRNLLFIGLCLDERFSPSRLIPEKLRNYWQRYENQINTQIIELWGEADRDLYCTIHRAERWVLSLVVGAFLAFFSLISRSNGDSDSALIFAILAPIASLGMPFLMDRDLSSKIERRRDQIRLDFPEFLNKLILLVNAGATVPQAWEKVVSESKQNTPLYRELRFCMSEIHSGIPESVSYERFARRCKIKEVIKAVSIVVLNLRGGGSEVAMALRVEANECWEARKATARRLGEKASSKLLIPMAIMLLGIIMIVALPAILAISGGI